MATNSFIPSFGILFTSLVNQNVKIKFDFPSHEITIRAKLFSHLVRAPHGYPCPLILRVFVTSPVGFSDNREVHAWFEYGAMDTGEPLMVMR